jgi:hypothetical protein
MKRRLRFLCILAPIAFIALGSFITMELWNWLMPALFGLGTLGFLQAAGILILARLLFGFKGGHHHGWHGHMQYAHAGSSCHPHAHFRKEWMHHRWQNLSPEEKEKCAKRFGFPMDEKQAPAPGENPGTPNA